MGPHDSLCRVRWRTSSYTNGGEACVEIAGTPGFIAVRDSKDPDGARLAFSRSAWRSFSRAIREGAHDC